MTKKITIALALAILLALTVLGLPGKTLTYEASKKEEPDELDLWIEKLAKFECDGCGENFKILDANNRHSYGCLQFQRATFDEMARRYNIVTEDASSIYSCEIQKQIARAVFLDQGHKAASHWYTSVYTRGLGLPPLVNEIARTNNKPEDKHSPGR